MGLPHKVPDCLLSWGLTFPSWLMGLCQARNSEVVQGLANGNR